MGPWRQSGFGFRQPPCYSLALNCKNGFVDDFVRTIRTEGLDQWRLSPAEERTRTETPGGESTLGSVLLPNSSSPYLNPVSPT